MMNHEYSVVCTECQHEQHIDSQTMMKLDQGGSIRCANCLTSLSIRKPNKKNLKSMVVSAIAFIGVTAGLLIGLLNLLVGSQISLWFVAIPVIAVLALVAFTMKGNRWIAHRNINQYS